MVVVIEGNEESEKEMYPVKKKRLYIYSHKKDI